MSTKFRVTLTKSEMRMAEAVGRTRTAESRQQGLTPILENDTQEYNSEAQEYRDRMGALGEIAVAKAFNVFFPGHVNVGKEIPDVYDWEVRATDDPDNRLIIRPRDKLDRIYILVCVGEEGRCWVRGYFDAKNLTEARKRAWEFDPGNRGPGWFIPNHELKNCDDLLKEIYHPDINLLHDETWDDEWKGPRDFSDFPPLNLPPDAGEVIPFPKK